MFNLSNYIGHYRELGFLGFLRRYWNRGRSKLNIFIQSLWWLWRSHQRISDAEFLKHMRNRWNSIDDLLVYLAGRPASSFILPHESIETTLNFLNLEYPTYLSELVTVADSICQNQIPLFNYAYNYTKAIDWHTDPVTRQRCPTFYIKYIERYIGSSSRPIDLIILWELNRHQHLIILGMVYWLTGDQKYVDAFCSQIIDWINTNPIQHGINWYYGLEISIRLIAWTLAFQFFRHSVRFRENIGGAFLKSLWQQTDFLYNNLQIFRTKDDVPNNHLMAELTGLTIIGNVFPEFNGATKWCETGLGLLNQQAYAQTHSDGVNKEQAIGYHRFIAELLLLTVSRSRQKSLPDVPVLENTLKRMLDYVCFSMTPIGTVPLWGDSDYGRALGLGINIDYWDFRPLLSIGAVLFNKPEWKFMAGRFDEEAFWLLGSEGLICWNQLNAQPPDQTSKSFTEGGYYIIRDKWSEDTDVAFFRCGPFGLGGEGHCAHSHCDLLSPILWIKGKPLLVDSGTFIYHGIWRDYFRLTSAHNTVMIDSQEQAIPLPQFNWQQIPQSQCLESSANHVIGSLIYPDFIKWTRELHHLSPVEWSLSDTFTGQDKAHNISWYFHFAPNLTLSCKDSSNDLLVQDCGKPFVEIIPPSGINVGIKRDWISYEYGRKELHPILHCIWRGEIPSSSKKFHWRFIRVE